MKNSTIKNSTLNRTMVFRVSEEIWQRANQISALAEKTVNDWARDEIVSRLAINDGLTAGEKLLHLEIANLRNLVETIMVGELFADEKLAKYQDALEQSLNEREAAVRDYFQMNDLPETKEHLRLDDHLPINDHAQFDEIG